jgi:hypothetical protein
MRRFVWWKEGYAWVYTERGDDGNLIDMKEVPDGPTYTGKTTPYKSLRKMVPHLPSEEQMQTSMTNVQPGSDGWRKVPV